MTDLETEVATLKRLLAQASAAQTAPLDQLEASLRLHVQSYERKIDDIENDFERQIRERDHKLDDVRREVDLARYDAMMVEELLRESEKVCITNADPEPLSVHGWYLTFENPTSEPDSPDRPKQFVFGSEDVIEPGERLVIVVYRGSRDVPSRVSAGRVWKVSWDYGEHVTLCNKHGAVVMSLPM